MLYPEADACSSIPGSRVFEIQWDSGYAADLAEAKAEYRQNLKNNFWDMNGILPPVEAPQKSEVSKESDTTMDYR